MVSSLVEEIGHFRLEINAQTIIFLLIILMSFSTGGFLMWRVNSLNKQVSRWESRYNLLEDRLIFLQTFASRMSQHYKSPSEAEEGEREDPSRHQNQPALSSKLDDYWDRWKTTKGLEWRLAEWQEQVESLRSNLEASLGKIGSIMNELENVHLGGKENALLQVLSERHMKQLLAGKLDDGSVIFSKSLSIEEQEDGKEERSWWWYIVPLSVGILFVLGKLFHVL